ncbi:hypothetical protein O181_062666 [Austropuccinia psidii MF-1]|uniref:GAG-pre-integrase domain-containing protein n=1 Tax=Austropuccinia psidii MF-1 TaxID=1389203 RepID=A0A9Q3EQ76_9BASI|nr:hypothetical protein [Austropuccinia psidii MF-1]
MTSDFTKNTALLTNANTQTCLHARLGHPSNQTLKSMGLPIFKEDHCNIRIKGKMILKTFSEQLEDEDSNSHNPPEEEAIQISANWSMEESNEEIIAAHPTKRIKVIGPRHPTLISSRVREENILPYHRQHKALMTLSNTSDPASFKQASKSDNA